MAKPKKNKTGLHKYVSSVLEGVRIPQGVHNWRLPDGLGPDWRGDSPEISRSSISSVFDGLCPLAVNDYPEPTRERTQDHLANGSRTEQGESANRVACYRDPLEEAPRRSLTGWLWEKLFRAKD